MAAGAGGSSSQGPPPPILAAAQRNSGPRNTAPASSNGVRSAAGAGGRGGRGYVPDGVGSGLKSGYDGIASTAPPVLSHQLGVTPIGTNSNVTGFAGGGRMGGSQQQAVPPPQIPAPSQPGTASWQPGSSTNPAGTQSGNHNNGFGRPDSYGGYDGGSYGGGASRPGCSNATPAAFGAGYSGPSNGSIGFGASAYNDARPSSNPNFGDNGGGWAGSNNNFAGGGGWGGPSSTVADGFGSGIGTSWGADGVPPVPDPSLRAPAAGMSMQANVDCGKRIDGNSDPQWKRQYEWTGEVRDQNRRIFGNNHFRHFQEQIINATVAGRDVFVLMPTGP